MEHMSSLLHSANIERTGVTTLSIGDGVHKPVGELFLSPQQIWFHKVHHCII